MITKMMKSKTAHATTLTSLLLFTITTKINAATVAWTGGPEDTFYCGFKWDEENCLNRQHCPSGRNEECEFAAEGQKCFANSPCDAQKGDGSGWVPGKDFKPPMVNTPSVPLTPRPTYTGISDDPTDHNWCGVGLDEAATCLQHCPSGKVDECPEGKICFPGITQCDARNIVPDTMRPTPEITPAPTLTMPPVGGPTPIPTDMPIEPPDELPFPSDDPTDHWFCGIGLDDANAECKIHCPSANECPIGQICYFGTACDARTFAPTPPPTNRPSKPPTNHPTNHPTNSMPPSFEPTYTPRPSASPSLPIPSISPTKPPTGRPTWAPLPALQLTFFCGADWNDAITNCKKRCPTGEDTECPDGDFCFTGTSCTEEMGYPETDDASDEDGGQGGQSCVPFQVTITPDGWPNEVSWVVNNTETEELVAKGGNDELVAGETYDYPVECINFRKGCYEFTITDSGGDGLCCGEGKGSYTISYDGKELKTGDVFYDSETTPFGLCGATETPTLEPTVNSKQQISDDKPNGAASTGGSGMGYRCVDKSLAERGYITSADKCSLFDNCFNPQIKVGDDWFCDEASTCIEAVACADTSADAVVDDSKAGLGTDANTTSALTTASKDDTNEEPSTELIESDMTPAPAGLTSPDAAPSKAEDEVPSVPGRPPTGTISHSENETVADIDGNGTAAVVNGNETDVSATPTLTPTTSAPTLGPCGGEPCSEKDHCRSQYGFCGPNPTYCNEFATWTKDCPDKSLASSTSTPTLTSNSPSAMTMSGTPSATTMSGTPPPTEKKFVKPGGGKGSISRPARTHSPTEPHPYYTFPNVNQPQSTENPSPSPTANAEMDTGQPSLNSISQATSLYPTFNESPYSEDETVSSAFSSLLPSAIYVDGDTPVPSYAELTPEPSGNLRTPSPTEISNEPTSHPLAESATSNPSIATTTKATSKATNEFSCTGDRCPIDSQCRSRYGTCGPGFIYCNVYSTWDSTCSPPVPGVTPTRSPTSKPTSDAGDTTEIGYGSPSENLITKQTFPPIARPTLTIITEAIPFRVDGLSMPGSNFDLGFAESDEVNGEDGTDDSNSASASDRDTSENKPMSNYQTAEYLDMWTNIAHSSGRMLKSIRSSLFALANTVYILIELT